VPESVKRPFACFIKGGASTRSCAAAGGVGPIAGIITVTQGARLPKMLAHLHILSLINLLGSIAPWRQHQCRSVEPGAWSLVRFVRLLVIESLTQ